MITAADIETIEAAAALLDGEALMLRHCSTHGPDHTDFGDDIAAEESYNEMQASVAALYALAERLKEVPNAQAVRTAEGGSEPAQS